MSLMDRIVRPLTGSRKEALANGAAAENLAADFLARRGCKLLSRNYRVRGGEIDLICEEARTVVFVEVRLRSNQAFGGAAASITARKRQRLILAARHWLMEHGERDCRFDCIVMDAPAEARIEWIKNAFSAD